MGPGSSSPLSSSFPLVSTALFYLYVHGLYGTFSPFAIYEGVMSAEQFREWRQMVMDIPLRERLDAFLDYFLDQRDGLLLYSPVYVFAFPGLVEMFRKARREFFSLAHHRPAVRPQLRLLHPSPGIFAPGAGAPARIWVAAVAIGYFLAHDPETLLRRGVPARRLRRASPSPSSFSSIPASSISRRRIDFTERPGDLFVFLGNMHTFLPPLLPSFIKVDNTRYVPNYVWVAALLGFVLLYLFLKRDREARAGRPDGVHPRPDRGRRISLGPLSRGHPSIRSRPSPIRRRGRSASTTWRSGKASSSSPAESSTSMSRSAIPSCSACAVRSKS